MKKVDEVRYSISAKEYIEKLNKYERESIKTGIEAIKEIPSKGDRRPMEGYNDGTMRLRISKFRVVYRYKNEDKLILYIIDIDSRNIV